MMKRSILVIPALVLFLVYACDKQQTQPAPEPERELSVPEKVELEIMDILSRDWASLSDTLEYFHSTMLSEGIMKGTAPDGVYYELRLEDKSKTELEATFIVTDSTWATVNGSISPLELSLDACHTDIIIKKEQIDTCSLSASAIKVMMPIGFLATKKQQAPLIFEGKRVGYLTLDEFENTDYSTGIYLVVHYDNDPRTFSAYDNGLGSLLKNNLGYVIE